MALPVTPLLPCKSVVVKRIQRETPESRRCGCDNLCFLSVDRFLYFCVDLVVRVRCHNVESNDVAFLEHLSLAGLMDAAMSRKFLQVFSVRAEIGRARVGGYSGRLGKNCCGNLWPCLLFNYFEC